MNRRLQLVLILFAVVAICSGLSHAAVGWLGIKASYGGYQHYGPDRSPVLASLHCSSLGYDGLDWEQITGVLNSAVESWATAGSTPSEWEMMYHRSPGATRAFVVLSPYDTNELFLCDFRADIVPLGRTVDDLRRSGVDWQFAKKVLSQYPVMLMRKLFPTVGRSDGVMVGVRAKLTKLAGDSASTDTGDAPKFGGTAASEVTEKLSEWPTARIERRMVLMRAACKGEHVFHGPKNLALARLLRQAERQGPVTIIVMPVSPIYQNEFMHPNFATDYENMLATVQRDFPKISQVRLDHIPALQDNSRFSDFVHLNKYGQQIATAAFVEQLKTIPDHP